MKPIKNKKQLIYVWRILVIVLVNILIITMVVNTNTASALSKFGSKGNEVVQIQTKLKELGFYQGAADGIFGEQTQTAVKKFQSNYGLTADGIAGANTLNAMGIGGGNAGGGGNEATGGGETADSSGTLKQGTTGSAVTNMQNKLRELGYLKESADGVFGAKTKNAVIAFQKAKGLTQDGIAGPNTLNVLGVAQSGGGSGGGNSNTSISGTLKSGMSGAEVTKLQNKLKALGYLKEAADGSFGAKTKDALVRFQKDKGLTPDGIAGAKTLTALGFTQTGGGSTGGSSSGGYGGYSESDFNLLAKVISAESRGELYMGQVAVGAVIMNRIAHPSFPNTLSGVIYQPLAFSCLNDGGINAPVSDSAYKAARESINGSDPSGGAIYYYNPAKATSQWIFSRPVITVIGAHRFCS